MEVVTKRILEAFKRKQTAAINLNRGLYDIQLHNTKLSSHLNFKINYTSFLTIGKNTNKSK